MENRRNNAGLKGVMLRAIARGGRWLILLLALYAIVLSLPKLKAWPESWEIPIIGLIRDRVGVADEIVICIALASLVLSHWGAREGKESAADLARVVGFLSGLPWAATLIDWVAKGVLIMFKAIKQRAMDMMREEGLAEGREKGRVEGRVEGRAEVSAEWQAWLERRVASNPDLLDDSDPPPAPPSGKIRNGQG